MKTFFIIIFFLTQLISDSVDVVEFESDIFSKESKTLKKLTISLHLDGVNLIKNQYKIQDTLNIIISSFYLEDLFTSKGKERFKEAFKLYIDEKYHVKVDDMYILKLTKVQTFSDSDELLKLLQKSGCCNRANSVKKLFEKDIKE